MPVETLHPAKLESWRAWIGRSERRAEVLCAEALRRFAVAIQADPDVERAWPPLGHWAFFLPAPIAAELGSDGHPVRGGLLPPIDLPRRMFAAAEVRQDRPLRLGGDAELVTTVQDVRGRQARSGDLVLVEVERALRQAGQDAIVERQTLIYRGEGDAVALPRPDGAVLGDWTPREPDLFRFSAATFNSHRIHYDRFYARDVEGYPDLVVQGPYTAARLAGLAQAALGRPLRTFTFRAVAPLFVRQPIQLSATEDPGAFVAVRCDGVTAMSAQAT